MARRRVAEFKAVALVHLNELLRVATRLCGDRSKAEDLVQETFLQAWKAFGQFQSGTNSRAWLYRILFYTLAHERRRTRRESFVFEAGPELNDEAVIFEPLTPDTILRGQLEAAFDRLPEAYRVVVTLADVEGLRYREISEALDIPLGTVMSRLNRGRKLLRRELARPAEALGWKR